MDSKKYFRDEYEDTRTNEEFFGEYYVDYASAKREVLYVFEDITVEKPNFKDFRHVLKCTLDDKNISYDEYTNGPQQDSMYRLTLEVLWFFMNSDQDHVYMIFKNNEYAGFFCLLHPNKFKLQKLTATEMVIRNKFKKSMVFVAAADAIINKMFPHDDLTLEGTNEKIWKRYTVSMDLDIVQLQVFKRNSKVIINNIIKRRMKRNNK
ncbi:MAG: hypothetical protein KAH01_07670 [Caldisericia bacterium]|nr:hypothetical protein [Caldisericia bacterium]